MPVIRRYTIEASVRVSRNYQSAEARGAAEFVFDPNNAPQTVAEAEEILKIERQALQQRVTEEAEALLAAL